MAMVKQARVMLRWLDLAKYIGIVVVQVLHRRRRDGNHR